MGSYVVASLIGLNVKVLIVDSSMYFFLNTRMHAHTHTHTHTHIHTHCFRNRHEIQELQRLSDGEWALKILFYSGHMTYDQSDNLENYYALNHLCIESLNVCNKQIMHLKHAKDDAWQLLYKYNKTVPVAVVTWNRQWCWIWVIGRQMSCDQK